MTHKRIMWLENSAALVGRVLLSLIFLISGWGKLADFAGSVAYATSKGLPFPTLMIAIAIIIEIVGGLMLLIGWKTKIAAGALILFVLIVSFVFHAFWNYPEQEAPLQMINFWKNFALIGGLLYAMAFGSGDYAMDYWRRKH